MDWEPTPKVAAGRGHNRTRTDNDNRPRAKWVSKDIINERMTNRECVRCGDDDHFINKCPLAPARRPDGNRSRQQMVSSTTSNTEVTPAARKGKLGKPAKKRIPQPRVEEVSESDWDTDSDSENE